MLSDEVASSSISIVKELAPVVSKLLTSIFGLAGVLAKGAWKVGGYLAAPAIRQLTCGERDLKELLNSGEELSKMDGRVAMQDEETKAEFDRLCKKYGVQYGVGHGIYNEDFDKDGVPDITLFCKKRDHLKMEQVMAELNLFVIGRESSKTVLGADAESINFTKVRVWTPKTEDALKKWQQQYRAADKEWNRGKCFDEAWENTSFENKTDIFKENFKMEGFEGDKANILLRNLKVHLTEAFGEDSLNQMLLHVKDEYILYFDQKDELHFINLVDQSYHKVDIEQFNECIKIMGEKGFGDKTQHDLSRREFVEGMRNNIALANQKLKGIYAQLDSKYKNYGAAEKQYLFECLSKKELYPAMDISMFDGIENDVYKMAAINEANQMGMDMSKILPHNFSSSHINSLIQLEVLQNETGGITKEVKDLFYRPDLSDVELSCMVEAYEDNPMIKAAGLKDTLKDVKLEQEKFECLLDGKQWNEHQKAELVPINDRILQMKEERLNEQIKTVEINDHISKLSVQDYKQDFNKTTQDHEVMGEKWVLFESKNDISYFLNENAEIKASLDIGMIADQYKDFPVKYAESKTAYIDSKGMEWREISSNQENRLIATKDGKAKLEKRVENRDVKAKTMKQAHMKSNINEHSKNAASMEKSK